LPLQFNFVFALSLARPLWLRKDATCLPKGGFQNQGGVMVKKGKPIVKKQSSSDVSTLASKILSGEKKATQTDAKKLAGSVLSQDEKRGQSPKTRK
jgi:hypothetical protein